MADIGDLPPELSGPLFELIILMGLDVINNASHRTIWDAFSTNRRSERLPLNFQLSNAAKAFPKPKQKPPGDPESPRGLLKTNWMRKHLFDVPSVVVLFVDLDWDHPQWNEKIVECASKVKSIRHSLTGRNSKLAVVLVQSTPPLPPDAITGQRATELCSACELSPKSLFVLPATDHLFGYIIRLEHAFYELAQNYYQGESKRVKTRKDALNKISHQPLLVRYQFKLAFFNELRQDSHSALRHYKMAYQHIQEIKPNDLHMLEMKTVAGFLDYKICRLCFQNNTPLDAIAQFRKHIDYFKDRPGPADLLFEHHAWMAKQFATFAELFDAAVQNGLAAIQTQHPGFYFQSASEQAIARKTAALRLCGHLLNAPYPAVSGFNPLEKSAAVEYYGQRAWRLCGLTVGMGESSVVQLDANLEKLGVLCLQWRESRFDQLTPILHYSNNALGHFKKYRCPRMKLLIIVRMGEQHFAVGNYEKALQILSHAMWEYRQEKWWLPLRHATLLALKCAYALANLKAYIALALEALCPRLQLDIGERLRIQQNLSAVLSGRMPYREYLFGDERTDYSSLTPAVNDVYSKVNASWTTLLNDRCFFLISMHSLSSCIDVTARFTSSTRKACTKIQLVVYVRSTAMAPLEFSKLSLQFSNSAYDQLCAVHHDPSTIDRSLVFSPNEIKMFTFEFFPMPDDVNLQILLLSVSLDVGNVNSNVYGSLQWENIGQNPYGIKPEYEACRRGLRFDYIQPRVAINILPREARVKLESCHNPPALMGERYKIKCVLKNLEGVPIDRLRFRAFIAEEDRTALVAGFGDPTVGEMVQEFAVIAVDQEVVIDLVVYCEQCTNDLGVHLQAEYDVAVVVDGNSRIIPCHCAYTERLRVEVISPFSLHTKLMSFKGDAIESLVWREPCIIGAELKCSSPDPVFVDSVRWELADGLQRRNGEFTSQFEQATMMADESFIVHTTVTPMVATNEPFVIGQLIVKWQRQEGETKMVETAYPLLSTAVESCPILVTCTLPSYSIVRHPLIVTYTIRNQTTSILEGTATLDSTEPFMFSGHKNASLRMLPESELSLKYVFLPLVAGHVMLPRLKFSCPSFAQDILDRFAQRNVLTSIFILPFGKEPPNSNTFSSSDGRLDQLTQALTT